MPGFSLGEVGSTALATLGTKEYADSAALIDGFIVTPDGVSLTPGTTYVANTKANVKVRLQSFVYSQNDVYTIEFGPLYIRFYRNNAQIPDPDTPSIPYELVTTYTDSDIFKLNFYQENDILYICRDTFQRAKLVRFGHDSWELNSLSMTDGPFQLENPTATTITSSAVTGATNLTSSAAVWTADNVGGIYRLRHDLEEQRVEGTIVGTGATLAIYVQRGGQYQVNVPGTYTAKVAIQFSSDNITYSDFMTIDSTDDKQVTVNGVQVDKTIDEIRIAAQDQYVRLNVVTYGSGTPKYLIAASSYSHVGVVRVDTFVSTQSVTGTVLKRLGATTATADWSEGSWSTRRGFPACTYKENEKICHGASQYEPNKIWESVTNDPESHRPGQNPTDAFQQTLASIKDPIQWVLEEDGGIRVGTLNEIAIYRPAGSNGGAGPLNPHKLHRKINFPCSELPPISAGFGSLVHGYGGRKIGQTLYSEEQKILYIEEKTKLVQHMMQVTDGAGITDMAFQSRPYPILWCCKSDGEMLAFWTDRLSGASAWSRAGYVGLVESIAVTPSGNYDQVWISASYTIDGSTVRFVGPMDELNLHKPVTNMHFYEGGLMFNGGEANITAANKFSQCTITLDAWPVDGNGVDLADGENIWIEGVVGMTELNGKIYTVSDANSTAKTLKLKDSAAVGYINSSAFTTYVSGGTATEKDNTFTGLSHLNGESAYVTTDGVSGQRATVAAGGITLDDYYQNVSVGLYQTRRFRTLPIESPSMYGKMKDISGITFMFFRTTSGSYGTLSKTGDYVKKQDFDWSKLKDPSSWEDTVYTGTIHTSDSFGSKNRAVVEIQQDYGIPMTILRIDPEVN